MSTSSEGTRRPLSIMLRYDTEGAACVSIWMQRVDSSSSVMWFCLRRARSFAPRKWLFLTMRAMTIPVKSRL